MSEVVETKAPSRSELSFRDLLDVFPAAVYTTDAEGTVTFYNRAAEELAGRTPRLNQDKWCVSWRLYGADGTFLPLDECPMAMALKQERVVRGVEVTAERPDGARVPLMPFPTPLRDAEGKLIGAVNMLVDISELKRAQAASSRRAEVQSMLYEFTDRLYRAETAADVYAAGLDAIIAGLKCARASILLFDEAGIMQFAAARGLSQTYRNAVSGHSPWKRGESEPPPIWIDDVAQSDLDDDLKQTVLREGIGALVFIPLLANGGVIGKFMAYHDAPHNFGGDEVDLGLMIARQLGFAVERRHSDDQRTLLINELNHRVKNTLATVQSLAHQTLRSTQRSEEACDLLTSRLGALARAHDLLTAETWEGADLVQVADRALAPFQAEPGRVSATGSPTRLTPKQALSLSVALHELATNAAKYGALSNATGQVSLRWRSAEGVLTLNWRESGGPQVTRPVRTGFGTLLIERSLTYDLGGSAHMNYDPEGVSCVIAIPLNAPPARSLP